MDAFFEDQATHQVSKNAQVLNPWHCCRGLPIFPNEISGFPTAPRYIKHPLAQQVMLQPTFQADIIGSLASSAKEAFAEAATEIRPDIGNPQLRDLQQMDRILYPLLWNLLTSIPESRELREDLSHAHLSATAQAAL